VGDVTSGIEGCGIEQFPAKAELLDANSLAAMTRGAQLDADHRQMTEGPVWRRSLDDRYYVFLLTAATISRHSLLTSWFLLFDNHSKEFEWLWVPSVSFCRCLLFH
jgi:hypothetical protein